MKIVDIEPMLAFLDDNHDEKDWMVNQYNADWIYSWLESQPTITPDSLAKRGRWMDCGDLAPIGARCKCSCCGGLETNFYRWCHNCGALMED